MKTEEAILFVEYLAREGYKDKRFKKESSRKQLMEVIPLLQQGEKYKLMWNEFKRDKPVGMRWINYVHDLQQKYFPKEAKEDENSKTNI